MQTIKVIHLIISATLRCAQSCFNYDCSRLQNVLVTSGGAQYPVFSCPFTFQPRPPLAYLVCVQLCQCWTFHMACGPSCVVSVTWRGAQCSPTLEDVLYPVPLYTAYECVTHLSIDGNLICFHFLAEECCYIQGFGLTYVLFFWKYI